LRKLEGEPPTGKGLYLNVYIKSPTLAKEGFASDALGGGKRKQETRGGEEESLSEAVQGKNCKEWELMTIIRTSRKRGKSLHDVGCEGRGRVTIRGGVPLQIYEEEKFWGEGFVWGWFEKKNKGQGGLWIWRKLMNAGGR